ncbi:hypothetical protein RirG_058010 [Rhizophagus irregularis DAOM 197198w]|uniref:Uncharacterized protein n=1 Tax=Rhizophagus irregularis (strain DAOM 197198w) TaxID=1432141 RepID=A0A015L1K6_RHIIW|nr:hypothetical protein RirG_058010 [Rhizophagus irregularis DAOM 197198w]
MQTIHHSHRLALELTKFLGMIQPANPENLSIDINNSLITIGSHENEVSMSYTYNETDPSSNRHNIQDIQENDDDISSSINIASREIVLNNGDSVNLDYQYFPENTFEFEALLNQRKSHDAYCSKPLKRKFKIKASNSIRLDASNSIQPNKASHFIAYFTKNKNPEQQFIKQREKRWKENRKNISLTLAQLYTEEIKKSRQKQKSNKRNIQLELIPIPNIENANIFKEFPLLKGDYVFVLYGETMCIGKVVAIYFEGYNNHCYIDEPITNLNDISYISLYVYLPIHLDLFSDILKKGCNLLTHHLASNIIYHFGKSGVSIDGNILKLLGNEKKYYFDYFGCKDIIQKIYDVLGGR